jgi:hypothetical protein
VTLATPCPSCGAELHFRSSVTVCAVCASCGSMVVRSDVSVAAIGTMASLPDDISPLRIGTGLVVDDRAYVVLGRIRMYWADGAWNEWFIDDGTTPGWLVEAQGFFSVAFPLPLPPVLVDAPWPVLGATLDLGGTIYRVSDLKEATCRGSEGELPFAAPSGRVVRYADLNSPAGGFVSLEDSDEGRRFSSGANVHGDDLGFSNLRPVEGWVEPPRRARSDGDPEFPPGS